ncbi:AAA family ATPase [Geothrix sp.]|jgi:hypothetical protein|uniref:AAA family ATPase n=1 Tax=Geothrix sp. TaxID=1962974 RepID=UPI0025BAB76F|nr:AAA family ATPase [Geothrix sp.]
MAWQLKAAPAPRAIYNLHKLAKNSKAPVLVVEGEKAADAASKHFPDWVVTTSGSATSATAANWSPLAGRRVAIWPDADDPGRKYAEEVHQALQALGVASAGIVALPDGLPEKWDLADLETSPVPDLDAEAALALIEEAARERCMAREHPTLPLPSANGGGAGPWIVGDVRRMLTESPPPVRWLVEGLIPGGVPGVLAARAGAGKSMTALSIGMGLASGLGVMGRPVSMEEARGVLFVGLEDDEAEFHRRLARGLELLKEDPEWTQGREGGLLRRLRPLFPNRTSGESLYLEDQWRNLADMASAIPGGCGLIILDTLARMADGDENKASDIRPFNEAVSALAQATGAAVLSIHHVGKGNDAPSDKKLWQRLHPEALRGSSAVEAAARFIIQMAALSPSEAQATGLEVDRALRGGYVALHLSKMSASEKGDTILLERRQADEPGAGFLGLHPDSERILTLIQGASAVLKLTKRDEVLLAIAEAGGLGGLDPKVAAPFIWPDSGNPRGQWDKSLHALRKAGLLGEIRLTDLGLAKVETLGSGSPFPSGSLGGWKGRKITPNPGESSSGRKIEDGHIESEGPKALDLPGGRWGAEEAEDPTSLVAGAIFHPEDAREVAL